jgi:hypothetical protein
MFKCGQRCEYGVDPTRVLNSVTSGQSHGNTQADLKLSRCTILSKY